MIDVKLAAGLGVFSWFGATVSAITQVVVGNGSTYIPLSIAVVCLIFLLGVAVRVTQWVDKVNTRLKELEETQGLDSEP